MVFESHTFRCSRPSPSVTGLVHPGRGAFARYAHDVVFDPDIVGREIIQRGRGDRRSVTQAETRVVPRAPYRFSNQKSVGERRAVVRAFGADGEPVLIYPSEKHGFTEGVPGQKLAGTHGAQLHTFRQVGPYECFVM
jgi:hypothetical protein